MRTLALVTIAATQLALVANDLDAAVVKLSFSGKVESVSGGATIATGLQVGDFVAGTVSYDTEVAVLYLANDLAGYVQMAPNAFGVLLPGIEVESDGNYLATVQNTDDGAYSFVISDGYMPATSGEGILVNNERLIGNYGIGFDDLSRTRVKDFELPTDIDLQDFQFSSGEINFTVVDAFGFADRSIIRFSIDTITSNIPEPSTLLLVVVCAGLPAVTHRKTKKEKPGE